MSTQGKFVIQLVSVLSFSHKPKDYFDVIAFDDVNTDVELCYF